MAAIRLVKSTSDVDELITELASSGAPRVLGFVNAHAMNSMVSNATFFDALITSDVLLRDGSGMKMLYQWCGWEPGLNMNGTDFIPKILASFQGRRVAFWGTEEPYLSAACACCENDYGVRVVSRETGFHDDDFYLRLAIEARPDLIVLGMGMPKQERIASLIRSGAGVPTLILCGGAIIDFLGGKVSRAPGWMRMFGIEWMYRLVREPRRLFHRYVIGNPLFIYRARAWRSRALEQ